MFPTAGYRPTQNDVLTGPYSGPPGTQSMGGPQNLTGDPYLTNATVNFAFSGSTVPTGFAYLVDSNGNILTDAQGNKIVVPQ